MVNLMDTEVFASDSQSPSASSDHRYEVNGVLGCGEIEDTEPIDEEIVLDSSLLETPFQNLYDDTELVDIGNCGLDEVVVDDSEDEDGGNGSVAAGEPICLRELRPKAGDILLESDGSNDHECQIGKQESNCDTVTGFQGSSRITANSHGPGLELLDSQEPGESTQADALGFVDQFLMDKDLDLSPVTLPENSWRRKSPPVTGAKGCQSLAKKIKTRSPTRKMSVFDWGSDQCDVSDPKNSPVTRASITCSKRREDHVAGDDPMIDLGVKKGSMDLCEDRKVSTHRTQRFMQNSSAKHHKMEQASGLSQGIMFISQKDAQFQDKASKEHLEPEEDFIDIGINTQIAAEAMSALVYAPCTNEEACESDQIPGKLSEMRDQVSNFSRRNKDTIEGGPERDNLSSLLSAPHKERNSKKKRKFTKEETGTNVSVTTCLLNLCEWRHPRAKRSRLMQRHHVPPRRSWGVSSVKNRSETNTLSSRLRVSLSGTREASSCQSGVIDLNIANHASPRKIYDGSHESPCNKDFPRLFLQKELTTRLGEPGIVGDFVWKDLRRRRNLAHVRVLFSHNLDDETTKQQKKIMVRLGISPASSSADSTHFIADRFARTRNMLEAIALGKFVVTPLWLESCAQTRCLIDEKSYILRDSKKEKDGFCMLTSLARAKQHPLLKGLKVCITPNIKPSRGMITDLVKMTQGQVVEVREIIAAKDRNFPDDLMILSCEEDRDFCLPFINQGAVIFTSELLLNGIVIQKLEYARHGLFSISEKGNQRNT
ncbi:unnamed protein product [Arabidopsis lyrata]|uniref:uncharacterized protein LOC9310947 isoform X1 n=1 Tax=Arabidopsis lyrata subsp. lyrata TaxID=81972 RepID=UPI000A29CBB3|nr:uncharacterized protein LOC9310947 isoform X1 [Arabidopsis lyrata subsp. lyrata]CAH8273329.1 unnamed protein product [Arabidopsis lyrata]|eukprot:XP_020876373.1 uncharacterized protein LOC9310947 isoform X1 [Arabidopsis lyrata subsp. lyrata]